MPVGKKKCPSGKKINPRTGRCVKRETPRKQKKEWVVTPETGRPILKGGPTYRRLEKSAKFKRKLKASMKSPGPQHHHSTAPISKMKRYPKVLKSSKGKSMSGWKKNAPYGKPARRLLRDACGRGCFFSPDTLGFPICRKCKTKFKSSCTCSVDCQGVKAALARSYTANYPNVRSAAKRVLKSKC